MTVKPSPLKKLKPPPTSSNDGRNGPKGSGRTFVCPICGKTFDKKACLTNHSKRHLKIIHHNGPNGRSRGNKKSKISRVLKPANVKIMIRDAVDNKNISSSWIPSISLIDFLAKEQIRVSDDATSPSLEPDLEYLKHF